MRQATEVIEMARVRRLLATGEARKIRECAGVSLAEVARAIGVGSPTVHRWERLQRRPRGDVGLRYLELLDDLQRCAR
jgi:DNA-binding transcriptional regulator YiaG